MTEINVSLTTDPSAFHDFCLVTVVASGEMERLDRSLSSTTCRPNVCQLSREIRLAIANKRQSVEKRGESSKKCVGAREGLKRRAAESHLKVPAI